MYRLKKTDEQYKLLSSSVFLMQYFKMIQKYINLSLFIFMCLISKQYNYTFHELRKQLENQVVPIQMQS